MAETQSLEREMEQTRQNLASTIDQLVYRAHPKTIVQRQVQHVKDFFVDSGTGEPRQDNIIKVAGGVAGVVVVVVVLRKITS